VIRRITALLVGLSAAPGWSGAQDVARRITITDLGPGAPGRLLRDALERPHRLVLPESAAFVQRRGESAPTSLIVLGRDAYVGGKVDGDVIVVDGDLFVRAGAEISGRAIAIGGGAYPSSLAYVGRGSESYRDGTFEITTPGGDLQLAYRSLRVGADPPLLFPFFYGFRLPSYDRVNGLSLPFGPTLTFAGERGELDVLVTYRSDLGKFDPSIDASLQMTRRSRIELRAARGSFTNDQWIYPDYLNSGSTLVFGEDTRNWYRADRGELTLHRLWETSRTTLEPFIGARFERSWAVGPVAGTSDGPWSVLGRADTLGMLRPNPQVPKLEIPSALAGTTLRWEDQGLTIRARTQLELRPSTNADPTGDEGFRQLTSDLDIRFPTFGEQTYGMEVHWVTTGGRVPMQRFAYIGGPGTMPFLEILEQGGGELLLVDQRYSIPLPRITVGFMGIPTLQLRHRLGAAGVTELPALEQMVGVGVSLTVIRGEVRMDPASGRAKFTLGFTFAR
jgi:hypothetical protein